MKRPPINADDVKWGPVPPNIPAGAQIAIISGDPGKEGLYVIRLKMPAGYKVPAHWHPQYNYTSEFLPLARKSIAEGGGKYVAGGFNKTVAFSGEPPPNRVVIIQFENMDKAKAWYDSPAQKDSHKIGDKFAAFREFIVEGVEQK
jgi:uncharacterized protein (DUF1330 family)